MAGPGSPPLDEPRPVVAATVPARPAAGDRLVFLDALRGFALVFMVLNHTGRWWMEGPGGRMTWPRYYWIYATMAVAAPIFLFLVGFCLPLSKAHASERAGAMLWKYSKRGARLILAGILLNVLVFPEDPIYNTGVLQTIGIGIVAGAAASLLLRRTGGALLLAAIAAVLYLSFAWSFDGLTRWVVEYPRAARVLFFECPPWPWVSLVLVGLALGDVWARRADAASRARFMWIMLAAGIAGFAWLVGYDAVAHSANRFTFRRDYILNHHWTPRAATSVGILGMLGLLMAAFYWLAEVRRYRMTWLVTLGRTALVLYFLHQLVVLTLVNQRLGLRFNEWWQYGVANLVLMVVLLGIGRLWLDVKAWWRRRPAGAAGGRPLPRRQPAP